MPGAVAPPFAPRGGSTHGGADENGTATRPVLVSHVGPQFTFTPRALASSNVRGSAPCFAGAGRLPPPLPLPMIVTTTAMTAMTATTGRYRVATFRTPLGERWGLSGIAHR